MIGQEEHDDGQETLWRRAYAVFEEAQDQPAADREAFARAQAGTDIELLNLVLSLIENANPEEYEPPRIGSRVGRYEITGVLGRGAMGQVYAARDTELGREVALKFLGGGYAEDGGTTRRLVQEAKAASALNHPNIVTVYDVVRDGRVAIAMELVEGKTLREFRGPQPVASIVAWGRQVAQALAATHARGIVHRDIKPENIMVRDDGYLKVLDFGLARRDRLPGSSASSLTGLLGGTLLYMSPEQTRGEEAKPASDIFSLGVTLYELSCGRHPFAAESPIDVAHAIAHDSPRPAESVRPETGGRLSALLMEMMAKDPAQRPDASEVERRLTLDSAVIESPVRKNLTGKLAALVSAIALAAAIALALRSGAPAENRLRLTIPLPAGAEIAHLAISPLGDHIAYVQRGSGTAVVYRRFFHEDYSRKVEGTEGATGVFFSPDGLELGVVARPGIRIVQPDGTTRELVQVEPAETQTAQWTSSGYVYYSVTSPPAGIWRIHSRGGTREPVLAAQMKPAGLEFPLFRGFIGGRLLFNVRGGPRHNELRLLAGGTGAGYQTVHGAAEGGLYGGGMLVYEYKDQLLAEPFDEAGRITGRSVAFADGVEKRGWPGPLAAMSASGVLAYVRDRRFDRRRIVWIDRASGARTDTGLPAGEYEQVRVSPRDARQIAVVTRTGPEHWTASVFDLGTGAKRDLLSTPVMRPRLLWSPDARSMVVSSERDNGDFVNLHRMQLGGRLETTRLTEQPNYGQMPTGASPDGDEILFVEGVRPETRSDLKIYSANGKAVRPLVTTRGWDVDGTFSPDGRWIAYASNHDGAMAVYVQPRAVPGAAAERIGAGRAPVWVEEGSRLLYCAAGKLFDVAIVNGRASGAAHLVSAEAGTVFDIWTRPYDVTPDGTRVLAIVREAPAPSQRVIEVIQNVAAEYRRLR